MTLEHLEEATRTETSATTAPSSRRDPRGRGENVGSETNDDVARPFTMHAARQILAIAGSAVHLEQQVVAIESAVRDAPSLAADLSRTLVETVCKTILGDRGQDCTGLGFKDLLANTYVAIRLTEPGPEDDESEREALRRLADNLDAAIGAISSLRHSSGLASHGKDAYAQPIASMHAEFAARAADALAWFLYGSHRGAADVIFRRLLALEDNAELNDWLDSSNAPIRINGLEYRPSEVLFYVDREAYLDLLANFAPSAGLEAG